MNTKSIPSLNALRAFESSARNLSFSKAAKELNVTPAAVGHQVKSLEHILNEQLFIRLNREIRLTEAGEALLPGLTDVFTQLSQVITKFRKIDKSRTLTVSTTISVAIKWLIPKLNKFKKLHPDIHIRIDSNDDLVNFDQEDVDIAIRYGWGDYPGLHVVSLAKKEIMFPVCSPSLLNGEFPLNGPEDLTRFTLLDQPIASKSMMWPDWGLWLKLVGFPDVEVHNQEQFDQSLMVIQAAVEGQGVALVDEVIAGEELASGNLVRPFDLFFPLPCTYYIVCPENIVDQYNVKVFTDWLRTELNS